MVMSPWFRLFLSLSQTVMSLFLSFIEGRQLANLIDPSQISALKGENVDALLETVMLVAEVYVML